MSRPQNGGKRGGRRVKSKLYYEQSGHCGMCGNWIPRVHATFEHIIPRSKGGPNTYGNGMMACFPCNNAKGDSTLPDTRRYLRTYAIAS